MSLSQTVQAFGVNAAALQPYLVQVGLGGSGANLYTDARLTELITAAAATINTIYITAGLDLDAVAAATSSVAYHQARQLVCQQVVLRIAFGLGFGDRDALQDLRDEYRDAVERLKARPQDLATGEAAAVLVTTNIPTETQVASGAYLPTRRWQKRRDI